MRVDATSYDDAVARILEWANRGESRYVCAACVNNVIEAHDDEAYRTYMNGADLVTPDGMPLVWGLRMLGAGESSRVYGPDLTEALCERAARAGVPVGFYGGAPDVLDDLLVACKRRWPDLRVAYHLSPPFRPLTAEEEGRIVEDINASGARILFVGIGTPKQDMWMARNRGRVQAVMLGVGAAFDFIAGRKSQAPDFLQSAGMEWLFRLLTEPKRLWKRYLYRNPRYVALFGAQVLRDRFSTR
jgi:N-acetylglucosaminyldiphosphoundecaprenol N-acetyl-beta-D-mannosaminyltransferase